MRVLHSVTAMVLACTAVFASAGPERLAPADGKSDQTRKAEQEAVATGRTGQSDRGKEEVKARSRPPDARIRIHDNSPQTQSRDMPRDAELQLKRIAQSASGSAIIDPSLNEAIHYLFGHGLQIGPQFLDALEVFFKEHGMQLESQKAESQMAASRIIRAIAYVARIRGQYAPTQFKITPRDISGPITRYVLATTDYRAAGAWAAITTEYAHLIAEPVRERKGTWVDADTRRSLLKQAAYNYVRGRHSDTPGTPDYLSDAQVRQLAADLYDDKCL